MLSLWLPDFAIELALGALSRRPAEAPPLVLIEAEAGRLLVSALDRRAVEAGMAPGMSLADARTLAPGLQALERDRAAERRALEALADWLERYSPWVALDPVAEAAGAAGLLLEVTGCAHLFGPRLLAGEATLAGDLLSRLGRIAQIDGGGARRHGPHGRLAVADTLGAAWALARYATSSGSPFRLAPPGRQAEALAPLPLAALRLAPERVELLRRFGLVTVGQLAGLPPETLTARAGPEPARRLAQALGRLDEPVSPRRPAPEQRVRRLFGEPIAAPEDLARGLEGLLLGLCERLEAAGLGARRVELALHRVDGSLQRLSVGLSRADRDADRLKRLFAQRLDRLDPGFGVDALVLSAPATEPLDALQLALPAASQGGAAGDLAGDPAGDLGDDLAALVDRLEVRLGARSVTRPAPRESHLPERAVRPLGPFARLPRKDGSHKSWPHKDWPHKDWPHKDWPRGSARPLRLLARPEPIEVIAALPDSPPRQFRWRRLLHRVVRAEGPERIAPEWWLGDPRLAGEGERDYFRVEDEDGRRFWLYRSGRPEGGPSGGRWYLQGLFG